MPPSEPTPAARRTSTPGSSIDRRTILIAAAVMVLAILGGAILVAVTSNEGTRKDTQGQLAEDGGAKPHIIPLPNSGVAPQTNGERGGWEQLALFGVMLTAMLGIGVVVFRGTKKARAGRARWLAAGETGRDGALAAFDQPAADRT